MNDKRKESIIVSLLAALLIPRIQKWTGVTLDIEDIAGLMVAASVGWHGFCAFVELHFPPPGLIHGQAMTLDPPAREAAATPFVPPNPEKLK